MRGDRGGPRGDVAVHGRQVRPVDGHAGPAGRSAQPGRSDPARGDPEKEGGCLMASLRKRGRVWFYRYVDADGVQREHKGCPDRRETEAMAAAVEAEASKVK